MTAIKELVSGRELLFNLTMRELRGKYKRTALGWAWSMLNPISTIIIYSIVFGNLLGVEAPVGKSTDIHNFTLWLTCGLLPWNFLNNGLQATLPALVNHSNLIKKVYFPREYIVASSVLSWMTMFAIELGILATAFAVFAQHLVWKTLPMIVLLVVLQALFVLGLTLIFSSINVYFRDVQHFTTIGMQIWFYLTPIVYVLNDDMKGKIGDMIGFYRLNPMLHFVRAYQQCFYDGQYPSGRSLLYILGSVVVALTVGFRLFSKLEPRFAEEL